jgi:hypothetical protein
MSECGQSAETVKPPAYEARAEPRSSPSPWPALDTPCGSVWIEKCGDSVGTQVPGLTGAPLPAEGDFCLHEGAVSMEHTEPLGSLLAF